LGLSSIEDAACKKIQERAAVGLKKYGTTMEREDFSKLDWLVYAQEEAMDLVVYLEKLIQLEQSVIKSITHEAALKLED
jgi:hypothetical protein